MKEVPVTCTPEEHQYIRSTLESLVLAHANLIINEQVDTIKIINFAIAIGKAAYKGATINVEIPKPDKPVILHPGGRG